MWKQHVCVWPCKVHDKIYWASAAYHLQTHHPNTVWGTRNGLPGSAWGGPCPFVHQRMEGTLTPCTNIAKQHYTSRPVCTSDHTCKTHLGKQSNTHWHNRAELLVWLLIRQPKVVSAINTNINLMNEHTPKSVKAALCRDWEPGADGTAVSSEVTQTYMIKSMTYRLQQSMALRVSHPVSVTQTRNDEENDP